MLCLCLFTTLSQFNLSFNIKITKMHAVHIIDAHRSLDIPNFAGTSWALAANIDEELVFVSFVSVSGAARLNSRVEGTEQIASNRGLSDLHLAAAGISFDMKRGRGCSGLGSSNWSSVDCSSSGSNGERGSSGWELPASHVEARIVSGHWGEHAMLFRDTDADAVLALMKKRSSCVILPWQCPGPWKEIRNSQLR